MEIYFIFWCFPFTFLVDGGWACGIWRASVRALNICRGYIDKRREGPKEKCVLGLSGATNCVCELGKDCLWLSVANRTLQLDKRPTSYGNSNSVQVFSAYTFAAQRAPDWPGEHPGPQERVAIYENKRLMTRFIHLDSFFERSLVQKQARSLSCSAATRWPCTPAQPQQNYWGATPGDRNVFSTPPAWAGRQERQAAFKMSTSELVALAAAPLEMWLGAVRQWEVLKKPWCWKYTRVLAGVGRGCCILVLHKTAAGGSRTASLSLTHLVTLTFLSGLQPACKFNGQDGPTRPRTCWCDAWEPLEFGGYMNPSMNVQIFLSLAPVTGVLGSNGIQNELKMKIRGPTWHWGQLQLRPHASGSLNRALGHREHWSCCTELSDIT